MMNDDSWATDLASQWVTVDVFCLSQVILSEAQTTAIPITREDHLISAYVLEPISKVASSVWRERANNCTTGG